MRANSLLGGGRIRGCNGVADASVLQQGYPAYVRGVEPELEQGTEFRQAQQVVL